ncbi:RHS repeat-associated core domain-containing protein [Leptospira sp. 96542]|nr:RHS repeat-associated core domain-containing protein [Leptospira sp. 96542]
MFGTRPGNISNITDLMNESRNQSFEYDHLSRVTKAIGKYGEENYNYHRNGNLLTKGAFSYSYENGNHIHAVTRVNSINTGMVGYSYDAMGNMIGRNGDTLHYNAQNKLKRIETSGGDKFEYTYDHSGMRIKKALQNSNTTTYSFGNYYEIHRTPGEQEKHTMYVIGVEGDMVAQYSRGDAILVNQMASASDNIFTNPFCKDVNIDCDTYWKNRFGFYILRTLEDTNLYVDGKLREGYRAVPWILLLGFLIVLVYRTRGETKNDPSYGHLASGNLEPQTLSVFGISLLPQLANRIQKQTHRYGTALLVVIFSFTNTVGCFPLLLGGAEAETGTPIWLLGLANGIPTDTPSVGDEPTTGGGGGGISSGNVRVTGMYFFHPDHLGSITMITDGNGNVLAGGERGGKSHITYKPYGEILRTDSYGPDITKFKYTGQEEDKESGLYYYKARYYDAALGKFIGNDGLIATTNSNGMNRTMYVEGNPLKFVDPDGNFGIGSTIAMLPLVLNVCGSSVVARGHNYTGPGSCSKNTPNEKGALEEYFRKYIESTTDPIEQQVRKFIVGNYYESQKKQGKPTFLNQMNRKQLALFLIGSVAVEQINTEQAVNIFYMMTNGVKEPRNAIDRASFWHDKYGGSSPWEPGARRGNNEWVKNAWKGVNNPYDLLVASTGTVLFKSLNLINDLRFIDSARRANLFRPKKWRL